MWYSTALYLHSSSLSLLSKAISLFQDRKLNTVALRKGNSRGFTSTDDEHVLLSCGEDVTRGVSDGDDIEGSRVLLDVDNGTNTTSVATLGDHGNISRLELDVINDLTGGNVDLDGVIDLDGRIRVSDGAAIVGDNEGDLL